MLKKILARSESPGASAAVSQSRTEATSSIYCLIIMANQLVHNLMHSTWRGLHNLKHKSFMKQSNQYIMECINKSTDK